MLLPICCDYEIDFNKLTQDGCQLQNGCIYIPLKCEVDSNREHTVGSGLMMAAELLDSRAHCPPYDLQLTLGGVGLKASISPGEVVN